MSKQQYSVYRTIFVAAFMGFSAAIVLFFLSVSPLTAAQGGSGGGGGSGGSPGGGSAIVPVGDQDQTRDQDQIRDQDKIQDPTTHDGDEPLQDRDQIRDRDRIYATTSTTTATTTEQLREREQEQARVMIQREENVPKAGKASELEARIRERERELEQERLQASSTVQNILKNQNQVRLAVHTLLASENLVPGIGKEVSAIAREFNNSVQATVEAENRIETRSRFVRFFMGGDFGSADEIQGYVEQNRERIQELRQLLLNCNCAEEVRLQLQTQLTNMENEQIRLEAKATKELNWKGLFGWFRD